MPIGEKLAAVMTACRYMAKDGRNDFQKYDYTTAASMFGKINEALTAQKLFTEVKAELVESRDVTTSKGNIEKFVVMKVIVTIHDADDPQQFVTFEGYGSGQDAGDKAIMKSNTAALKYAYIGGLCIAMANDPETDSGTSAYQPARHNSQPRQSQPSKQNSVAEYKCSRCGAPITPNVLDFSVKKFGKPLCIDCQKKINGG